jgi:cyclic-di-GMP-binding protein
MSINLSVPTYDQALHYSVETHPKQVDEWLQRLPLASPVNAARQLLTALASMNRVQMDETTRHKQLTLYRPVIARVARELESLIAETCIPPAAKQRQIGTLMRELLVELAYGYKRVLLAMANRRFTFGVDKAVSEVTTHIMAALSDILAVSYRTYSPFPVGVWREMHRLYQFAQETGFSDVAVAGITPSLVYRQALLTALADPYHMHHAELVHTRLYLENFGHLARLVKNGDNPSGEGFFIPTDADAAIVQTPGSTQEALWLQTGALCHHLQEATVKLKLGDTPRHIGLPHEMESGLAQHLFMRLFKNWGKVAQRVFKRYPSVEAEIHLVSGVLAIHRLLELSAAPRPPEGRASGSVPLAGAAPTTTRGDPTLTATGNQPHATYPAEATLWKVMNDSAGGLALSGTPCAPLKLKVGDAIVIQESTEGKWSLAVIRWIRMADAQGVRLGVERISPRVQPVRVRPLRGQRSPSAELALYIPGSGKLYQKDRLLLPRHVYQAGLGAEVLHADRQSNVTFGRLLEQTGGFDLIEFSVL